MGVDIRVIDAEKSHVEYIAPRLREADVVEIERATGKDPESVLFASYARSLRKFTPVVDGDPVGMFGVVPQGLMSGVGVPWLLVTPEAEKHWLAFGRISLHAIQVLRFGFEKLENWVDVDNTVAIAWLKWLDFKIAPEPEPFGVRQAPFYHFEWRREHV